MYNKKNKLNSKGFGLLEMVIGISVAAVVFLSIGQITILSLKVSQEKDLRLQASNLAKEGLEAVRTIRDDGWTTNISGLTFGSTYYIATSTNQWILTGVDPGLIDGQFTRTLIFENVSRDANDDITLVGGVDDPGTKKVTATVYWNGLAKNVQLTTYIMNILND